MQVNPVGRIAELWRYPVKSMAGERLSRALVVERNGLVGDRGWALRDERAGEIRGAKKLPALMRCRARYLAEPTADSVPSVEITTPDGAVLRSGERATEEALSRLLGRPVTLWPLQPASALDHYRRGGPDNPDRLVELTQILGLEEGDPFPALVGLPPEIIEYVSVPGTYFDEFPILLVTTSTLRTLAGHNPAARFDVRRFRPNLLVDTGPDATGYVEQEWRGRHLRAGGLLLRVETACVRCVMTTHAQDDLPKDPSVLRTVVRDAGHKVGVYASVVSAGEVAVGDELRLEQV